MNLSPVVEDVLVVAQEGLLGIRHQKAYDVVTDAGEALRLGLGEVDRRDVLEALLVELLLGYVVTSTLGDGVYEDEFLVVRGDEVCCEVLRICVLEHACWSMRGGGAVRWPAASGLSER